MDRIPTEHQSPRPASPDTEAGEAADAPAYAPVRTHTNSRSIGRRRSSLSGSMHRTHTTESVKETRDPNLDINLPYRTLTATANLAEYTTEEPTGSIVGPLEPDGEHRYKLVTFVPGDPQNPKNWSKAYKWYCTMVVAITCFVVAFASSVITADLEDVAEEFNVSEEVALLPITVFVVGFGVGPMIFAPLSEIFGRRIIYGTTLLLAVIFIIPCAVAPNIGTLIVCRAIDGIAFSAPMTLVGGTLADLWRNEERGVPMAAFSAAPFIGPAIGPLVGGFLADAAGWRWLYWIQLILSGIVWFLITFTVPETYAPTILARRAKKLRKSTGSEDHVTEQDLDLRPLTERLGIFLIRPFQLLFGELIVFLISLYMSVLYGLLYMFFVAYPIIYQKGKGYSAGTTGLMFIPVAVGVILSALCAPLVNKHYLHIVHRFNGKPPAEYRLIPMMASCWFIPIGLAIFAWTSYPRLSWVGPALGGLPVGFGFIFLYNAANNYLVDSYQHQAASALAAKTCIRSFWGAGVVLFTNQMYNRLGYQWAGMLLCFISLACCAIPFLFWIYGARIRARSKYAYAGEDDAEFNGAGSSGSDEEKGKAPAADGGLVRDDEDRDDDLRRARSYVSNP
ncbi:putative polyamine transporter 2 protein [Phaeoacremonium minimum UCRPA7]|uniref:Putative polyamine transporter 2 protein n=1 Tax=Phaeoacremonium minimum (strain UCR-PA7) TaxID=1286976 RepID=R8BQY7_PHAM7|nr:putative polyamine transporter 2 protein [Phaeoacremonium minimum UCRPA7]EOO01788.1 putative polyamine transporter 2 protein [Phaeoacremonium minimum UCRPA7]